MSRGRAWRPDGVMQYVLLPFPSQMKSCVSRVGAVPRGRAPAHCAQGPGFTLQHSHTKCKVLNETKTRTEFHLLRVCCVPSFFKALWRVLKVIQRLHMASVSLQGPRGFGTVTEGGVGGEESRQKGAGVNHQGLTSGLDTQT